jgi:hypothetical protein
MDDQTLRIIGGCYMALARALSEFVGEDAARRAHSLLFCFGDTDDLPPEDRRAYRFIADSASLSSEDAAAENAALDSILESNQIERGGLLSRLYTHELAA